MTDLAPLTALGGTAPRVDRIGTVTITENPDLSIASVALRRGASLPDLPGPGLHRNGILWTGPDQWLMTGPHDLHFAATVKARFGSTASVTDQTDGWVAFDILAPDALFERLCNIDMPKMQPGQVIRTVIEHLGCLVIREAAGVRVLGARSSAASLHHALTVAARAIA